MKKISLLLQLTGLLFLLLFNSSCKKLVQALGAPNLCNYCPCTNNCPVYNLGDQAEGGKVAYIYQPSDPGWSSGKQSGIIAYVSDQGTGTEWGCNGILIDGADSTTMSYGYNNSNKILAGCTTPGIAAKLCRNLVVESQRIWYLPSKDELNKLYQNRAIIGGFDNKTYWSSSQSGADKAWCQDFSNGIQGDSSKSKIYYVRAVRYY